MLKFGCGDFFSNDVSRRFPLKIGGSGSWSPHCQDLRLRSAECSILGTSWFELIDRDSIAIPTIDVDCDDTYRPKKSHSTPNGVIVLHRHWLLADGNLMSCYVSKRQGVQVNGRSMDRFQPAPEKFQVLALGICQKHFRIKHDQNTITQPV